MVDAELSGQPVGARARKLWRECAPERRLLAAVLLQAMSDALDGDADAIAFMDEDARPIAGWLGLPLVLVSRWRYCQRPRWHIGCGVSPEETLRRARERVARLRALRRGSAAPDVRRIR